MNNFMTTNCTTKVKQKTQKEIIKTEEEIEYVIRLTKLKDIKLVIGNISPKKNPGLGEFYQRSLSHYIF